MSFAISETVKWKEDIQCGIAFDLIDRKFVINESRENSGLKLSVNFRRTKENNPEMKMKIIEGAETLNDPVSITLGFVSSDGSGEHVFNSTFGLNVESLKLGYSCPFVGIENFRNTHAMIQSDRFVIYTMKFNLNLKNLVASPEPAPEPKKVHEKLYLDHETSDVKIDCKGHIFSCHRNVLR